MQYAMVKRVNMKNQKNENIKYQSQDTHIIFILQVGLENACSSLIMPKN